MDWIRQESSREELSLLNVVAHTKSVVLLENFFYFFNNSVYLSSTCFIQRVFKFHFYFLIIRRFLRFFILEFNVFLTSMKVTNRLRSPLHSVLLTRTGGFVHGLSCCSFSWSKLGAVKVASVVGCDCKSAVWGSAKCIREHLLFVAIIFVSFRPIVSEEQFQ